MTEEDEVGGWGSLIVNFRQTIINIKRIITLAVDISFLESPNVLVWCSATAESKPSFILSLSPPISPRNSSISASTLIQISAFMELEVNIGI